MLQVTEPALAHLADMLQQSDAPDDAAIRFVVSQEGVQLALAQTDDAAETFDHDGKTVLVLDEQTSQLLADRVLQTEETPEGTSLKLEAQEAA